MFTGSITALITPFRGGAVDEKAFQDLVQWQIDEGTNAVVPCGTTGESPVLSHDEHNRVIELCIEVAKEKIPVIAGTGSNSTEEAIALTQHAADAGADAALVVTPYYNKPSQAGMIAHFTAIADAVELPIIIYNIPPRSVIDMSVETMTELAEHPNIVGVKDATGDLARPLASRIEIGREFCLLSGDDDTAVAFLAQGGFGCISVSSNVAPRLNAELHDAWRNEQYDDVWRLRDILQPLNQALFCEPNPAPVKFACSLIGKCLSDTRPPMVPLSTPAMAKVEEAMRDAGLLD
ncbi:MAG: 4-hydroxy-tetrahydrodipicolinate synthase [Alphaproteobacteria bacterium]|nr:4-hydroxy-tetrahydrodipicolinate synthase [Alphaproteobacteria bacterium]